MGATCGWMVIGASTVEVLLVQLWTLDPDPILRVLRVAGLDARVTRVDIEPALHAAVNRQSYDLVLYDPATPGLPIASVEAALRASRCGGVLLIADDLTLLAESIRHALRSRRC